MFDQKKKRIAPPVNRKLDTIYDENPFQHFNNSQEGSEILTQQDWPVYKRMSLYTYYARPGKDGGVSASFNKQFRYYYMFTTSTDLDGSKAYTPSALLCELLFNGDYKKLYKYLIDKGYGKLKPTYEAQAVKKYVESGRPLPANFSPEAANQLEAAKQFRTEKISAWYLLGVRA